MKLLLFNTAVPLVMKRLATCEDETTKPSAPQMFPFSLIEVPVGREPAEVRPAGLRSCEPRTMFPPASTMTPSDISPVNVAFRFRFRS